MVNRATRMEKSATAWTIGTRNSGSLAQVATPPTAVTTATVIAVAPNQLPLSNSGPRAKDESSTATALAMLGPRTPPVEARRRGAGAGSVGGRVAQVGAVCVAVIARLRP